MNNKRELAKFLSEKVIENDLINLEEDEYSSIFLDILVEFEELKNMEMK